MFVNGGLPSMNLLASNLGAIMDLIALIVIIAFTLVGLKNGFAKTFVSMFGTVLSLLFAALLCKVGANFLQKKYGLITTLSNWASGIVTNFFGDNIANVTLGEASAELLASKNLSQWLIGLILSIKSKGTISNEVTLNQIISPVFGYYTVLAIALIGFYILFRILFFLFGEIVKKAHFIKVVGVTDTVLGAVLGFFHAIIILQFCIMIIQFIPFAFFQNIALQIDASIFMRFISNINVFGLIIRGLSNINLTDIILSVINATV